MKKSILMVMALMVLAVPTVTGQKINAEATLAKLAKCDADVANEKKAVKSATWINRAKVYFEALELPTKNLFGGCETVLIIPNMGEPEETTTDKAGRQVWVYPWVKLYIANNRLIGWEQTREIKEGLYDVIREATDKACAMDEKAVSKVKPILDNLIDYYKTRAAAAEEIQNYRVAVDSYVKAAELQGNTAIYSQVDPQFYFSAGGYAAFLGGEDASFYKLGEQYLNKAKELGYVDNNGNLYYFLFHCYYGQKDADRENVFKAKAILLEGIEKFPTNDKILDNMVQLYTMEEGVGDPAELVGTIDKFLAETPDNPDLWFGRGQVFYKLKNYDECIVSFLKINELKPNDYDTNFYLGYFYITKGDEENRQLNAKADTFTSMEEYQEAKQKVDAVYMNALPYFEKAFELNSEKVDCAQMLKELCFRLRIYDGVMDKYNKYNAAYKKLKGIE